MTFPRQRLRTSVRRLAPVALLVACAFSASVHLRLAPEHITEAPALGYGFVIAAALLVLLGFGAFARPQAGWVTLSGAAVLAALIAAYALSRTAGLPGLHPEPEAVDLIGLITKAIEAAGLALALLLNAENRSRPRPLPKTRSTTCTTL